MTELHVAASKGDFGRLQALLLQNKISPIAVDDENATPLHHAAFHGHLACVKALVKKMKKFELPLDVQDNKGSTPLHNAAFNGHLEVIKYFLKHSSARPMSAATEGGERDKKPNLINKIDFTKGTPLHNAACNGHENAVRLLLEAGAQIWQDQNGFTALHYACYNGHFNAAKVLLEKCVPASVLMEISDMRNATALHYSCAKGYTKIVDLLVKAGAHVDVQDKNGSTPLHFAAYGRHTDCISILVKRGANVNIKDYQDATPLHKIAFNGGDAEAFLLLLGAGADVNFPDKEGATALHKAAFRGNNVALSILLKKGAKVDTADKQGGTPLYNAAYSGHIKALKMLLAAGANPNIKEVHSKTPLHAACCFDHWECLYWMLAKDGGNAKAVDHADKEGMTALHYAAFSNSTVAIQLLIDKGADVNSKNSHGITPLHIATFQGQLATVQLLLSRGAKPSIVDDEGRSVLHYAAARDWDHLISFFVYDGLIKDPKEKGSNLVDLPDKNGMTPLHYAIRNGAINSAIILVEQGADLRVKDKKGLTPRRVGERMADNPTMVIFQLLGKEKKFNNEGLVQLYDFKIKSPTGQHKVPKFGDGFELLKQEDLDNPTELSSVLGISRSVYQDAVVVNQSTTYITILKTLQKMPKDSLVASNTWNLISALTKHLVAQSSGKQFKADELMALMSAIGGGASLASLMNAPPPSPVNVAVSGHPAPPPAPSPAPEPVAVKVVEAPVAPPPSGEPVPVTPPSDSVPAPPMAGVVPPPPGKMPPPPPPMLMKKKAKPLHNFRKLQWTKVPAAKIAETIWATMPANKQPAPGQAAPPAPPPPDKEVLIEKFVIPKKAPTQTDVPKPAETTLKPKQVIDMKRATNLGILLSRVKMPYSEVKEAIIQLDEDKLNEDMIKNLAKMTPDPDEITALQPYKTAPPEVKGAMGDVEQFFMEVMEIPRLKNRLDCMIFKRTFEERLERLRGEVDLCMHAVDKILASKWLAELFELVLVTGNYLNEGSDAGYAAGFTLESLPKVRETKSPVDPAYSILHYVADYVLTEKNGKAHLKEVEDFSTCIFGSKDNFQSIQNEHAEMASQWQSFDNEIKEMEKMSPKDEKFLGIMRQFRDLLKNEWAEFCNYVEHLKNQYKKMMNYFLADKAVDIPTVLLNFSAEFQDVVNDIQSDKVAPIKKIQNTRDEIKGIETDSSSYSTATPNLGMTKI